MGPQQIRCGKENIAKSPILPRHAAFFVPKKSRRGRWRVKKLTSPQSAPALQATSVYRCQIRRQLVPSLSGGGLIAKDKPEHNGHTNQRTHDRQGATGKYEQVLFHESILPYSLGPSQMNRPHWGADPMPAAAYCLRARTAPARLRLWGSGVSPNRHPFSASLWRNVSFNGATENSLRKITNAARRLLITLPTPNKIRSNES